MGTTKTSTTPFDAAEYLDSDETIAIYLTEALRSGDLEHFQQALQTAARARGMANVADGSGMGRESLYKALKPGAHPRFETVQRVLGALGVELLVRPTPGTSHSGF